jgi:TolA-binding protein
MSKKTIISVSIIILVLLVAGISYMMWSLNTNLTDAQKKNTNLSSKLQDTSSQLQQVSSQLNDATGQLNDATNQLNSQKKSQEAKQQQLQQSEGLLKVTSPKDGDQLCYGNSYTVAWQAPSDMRSVTVTLYTPISSSILGSFPAIGSTLNGVGQGGFLWDLKNQAGYIVPANQVYTITISGIYQGQQTATSSEGLFSVGNCN